MPIGKFLQKLSDIPQHVFVCSDSLSSFIELAISHKHIGVESHLLMLSLMPNLKHIQISAYFLDGTSFVKRSRKLLFDLFPVALQSLRFAANAVDWTVMDGSNFNTKFLSEKCPNLGCVGFVMDELSLRRAVCWIDKVWEVSSVTEVRVKISKFDGDEADDHDLLAKYRKWFFRGGNRRLVLEHVSRFFDANLMSIFGFHEREFNRICV